MSWELVAIVAIIAGAITVMTYVGIRFGPPPERGADPGWAVLASSAFLRSAELQGKVMEILCDHEVDPEVRSEVEAVFDEWLDGYRGKAQEKKPG